jgi:hypothetical protein
MATVLHTEWVKREGKREKERERLKMFARKEAKNYSYVLENVAKH